MALLRTVTIYTTSALLVSIALIRSAAAEEELRPTTYDFQPSPTVQFDLQAALINAIPGDVVRLGPGRYEFDKPLDIVCDNITLRGAGSDQTILSFRNQTSGDSGIHATGNAFVIEDLAVEDTIGNAIKILGAIDVTVRGVRVEWTDGPKTENGAYGIYPVECENVLLEDCVAIGASDAGIYVGQSDLVIVRRCQARQNVAGIEIENTTRADVYENVATDNSGGLLVFDLPGLKKERGAKVRLFNNRVTKNNHPNFASKGSMVSAVPPGTGVMLMATDEVEIFDNDVDGNDTCGILVVSFLITQREIRDATYDPFPESFSIHNNRIRDCGARPSGLIGENFARLTGLPFPPIVHDGLLNPAAQSQAMSIRDNGEAAFANLNFASFSPERLAKGEYRIGRSLEDYQADIPNLPEVILREHAAPQADGNPAVKVYRAAPKSLLDWGLYEMKSGHWNVNQQWQKYDLNTPLFSDYTTKHRYIKLPAGSAMRWQDQDVLDMPVGTIIAKTFAYPDAGIASTGGERYVETRIELHEKSGWYGYSYIWNSDQTDAELKLGGGVVEVAWTDAKGTHRIDYEVPNANQCITCHSKDGTFVPLGPTTRNLNRGAPGASRTNQLARWIEAGTLEDAPPKTTWPKLADYADSENGTVDARARAWLEVNCAHCHNPAGSARTSGLDLRSIQADAGKFGVFKSPVAAGKGTGDRRYDIVPGKPDESILMYRIETDEAGMRMPNLARAMVHDEAVALIRKWIEQMEATTGE